jgi:hypothetical protein
MNDAVSSGCASRIGVALGVPAGCVAAGQAPGAVGERVYDDSSATFRASHYAAQLGGALPAAKASRIYWIWS